MKLRLFVVCYILHSIHAGVSSELQLKIIAGGENAPEGVAKYQCSLQYKHVHFCGCAVIDRRFVITASHCLKNWTPEELRVMVGSKDLRSGGTHYNVERLILHKYYNETTHSNDIALVKVEKQIQYTDKVEAIELEDEEVPDGTEVQLTGWGRLKESGRFPVKLQYIKLYILGMERCKMSLINSSIHDCHICTEGMTGKGACEEDSGGPLVRIDSQKLVGVVNFGYNNCTAGQPDVFAKISYFIGWIKKHLLN